MKVWTWTLSSKQFYVALTKGFLQVSPFQHTKENPLIYNAMLKTVMKVKRRESEAKGPLVPRLIMPSTPSQQNLRFRQAVWKNDLLGQVVLPSSVNVSQVAALPGIESCLKKVWARMSCRSWGSKQFDMMNPTPLFVTQILDRYRTSPADHPQGAGRGGLRCPSELVEKARPNREHASVLWLVPFKFVSLAEALANHLSVSETCTDGNCAPHAFVQSGLSTIHTNHRKEPWLSWRKTSKKDLKTVLSQARKLAVDWPVKSRHELLLGGLSVQDTAWLIVF